MIVSVAVVAYNAEKTLPLLLNDLREQDYPHEKIEILLIDSMSEDGTRRVMADFKERTEGFYDILLLENPGKIIPRGHNVALEHYRGDALVRVDAHVKIPADFISLSVKGLLSGEDVCGGIVESVTDQEGNLAQTLLIAENSVFCGGAAGFRRLAEKDYVNTLAFALYRREVFDTLGGFVNHTIFNEDMIYASKAVNHGWKIAYAPDAQVVHSHNYTAWQQFTRNFDLGVSHAQFPEVFAAVPAEGEGMRLVADTAKYLLRHHPLLLWRLFVHSAAKLIGYRLGKLYEKLPAKMVRVCSMQEHYWK